MPLVPDPQCPGAFRVVVGGASQSWVDPARPDHLIFEYVIQISLLFEHGLADVDPAERIRVIHIGGAGLSIPRWIAWRRPGTAQIVCEPDVGLTEEVRRKLPLQPRSGIKVRDIDGRSGVAIMPPHYADLVVLDAFDGARVPGGLVTAEFQDELVNLGRGRRMVIFNVTDSSHRFERGVDFTLQRHAMERATALLLEICGGEAGEICEVVSEQYLPKINEVTLRREKLDSLLGHHIETETVTEIFERLGFAVKYANDVWTVTSASWRFDIEIEEDLIEEVARIYGYNSIPNNAPLAHLRMREHKESDLDLSRIKTALVDADYQEAITYSFVDPKVQTLLHSEIEALVLPNPISVEMSAMRVSLLSGLLGAVLYNQNRQQNRVRLFETGLRFVPDANAEFGVRQEFVLAGVITGTAKSECWTGKAETVDFFDLKGDLESILSLTEVGSRVKFVAKAHSALHPGQSSSIELDGKEIGFIGTIHPLIAQKLGLNGKAVVFEILWDAIANRRVVQAKEISKFPANRRDLALVVADNVPAGDIIDACKQAGGEKLTQVNLFDVYQGIGVASGHKSLAISLIIQDNEKTLEDDEINAVISAVLNEVKQRFNAELRD